MDDTPKPGETVAPKAPENNANPQAPVSTPSAQGNASDGEAEKLRKELEQARIRNNQLENEKKQREEAEAARKAKELEEQNQFEELYKQEKAKREAIEADKEAEEKSRAISEAKKKVLSGYSDDVRTLAEEAGLDLTSDDESDVKLFTEKLDKINTRLSATSRVGANNPHTSNKDPQMNQDELRMALKDPAKFHEIISKRPGIARMMSQR